MNTFYKPAKLFSVDTNPKTVKGQKYGFKTAVLYLAPAKLSGFQVCPMAQIAGCEAPCLNTAGNPAYAETKSKGRLNKTLYFFNAREQFMNQMAREISLESGKAQAQGYTLLVRPNGTSDIKWERVSFTLDNATAKKIGKAPGYYENIMTLFPEIQFYDYTKIANRKWLPANYDLTFSLFGHCAISALCCQSYSTGSKGSCGFQGQKEDTRFFFRPAMRRWG
jgi:hypothetical protein